MQLTGETTTAYYGTPGLMAWLLAHGCAGDRVTAGLVERKAGHWRGGRDYSRSVVKPVVVVGTNIIIIVTAAGVALAENLPGLGGA